jgi:LacI family transcriptional regulator
MDESLTETTMAEIRRIALLLGQDIGYTREVLRGVQAFGHSLPNWVFRDAPPDLRLVTPLQEWKPHGIIAHLFDQELADALRKMHVPLVNTTSTLEKLNVPLVEVNHTQIGNMAAADFLDRGFHHFGYFGSSWTGFSVRREAAFRKYVEKRGFTVSSCYVEYLPRPPVEESWKGVDTKVRAWLKALPKPVAIMSSNDIPARELAEICRELKLNIPEQVALLGVDNDELECQLCTPNLSSIALPAQRIGYEAAKLLHRMMDGKQPRRRKISLPPLHVVTRQSTDTLAIQDEDLADALAFIRKNAGLQIGVESILAEVPVSRRALERKFQTRFGRTVLAEIRRSRLERAKALLTETDLQMPTIAASSGFSGARRFAVVFKQIVGVTPTAYRAQSRLKGLTQNET